MGVDEATDPLDADQKKSTDGVLMKGLPSAAPL
jgi:hypothetical protein